MKELGWRSCHILRDVPLFKDLDQTYLKNIAAMFSTEHVPGGRTVITERDEGLISPADSRTNTKPALYWDRGRLARLKQQVRSS